MREVITVNPDIHGVNSTKGDAMIIVIDYDAGNTANVLRALKRSNGCKCLSIKKNLSCRWSDFTWCGCLSSAMAELERRGLVAVIKEAGKREFHF